MNATILILALLAPTDTEREWCERLAPKYEADVEVLLYDGTRCDLVTETEAVEVDWAYKWAEAIGQAQWYGLVLHKKPTVLLLVKDIQRDMRHVHRCQAVCAKLGMRLYVEPAIEKAQPLTPAGK